MTELVEREALRLVVAGQGNTVTLRVEVTSPRGAAAAVHAESVEARPDDTEEIRYLRCAQVARKMLRELTDGHNDSAVQSVARLMRQALP